MQTYRQEGGQVRAIASEPELGFAFEFINADVFRLGLRNALHNSHVCPAGSRIYLSGEIRCVGCRLPTCNLLRGSGEIIIECANIFDDFA